MTQLVGQTCVRCAGRIAATFDAEFCAACGSPTHVRCKRPFPGEAGLCPACGTRPANPTAEVVRREREEAARRATPTPSNLGRTAGKVYGFVDNAQLVLLGIAFLLGGVAFVALADLRDDPRSVSVGDLLRFAGMEGAGIALLALARWLRRRERSES